MATSLPHILGTLNVRQSGLEEGEYLCSAELCFWWEEKKKKRKKIKIKKKLIKRGLVDCRSELQDSVVFEVSIGHT